MLEKSVREAVEEGFDEETCKAFGDKYLELVYANWSEAVRALRRTVFLLVITAVGFVILEGTHSGQIDLGPIRVDNVWAVLTLIPILTSFLIFEALDLTIADHYYKEAASAAIKSIHPSIHQHRLHFFLEPATGFAIGMGSMASLKPKSPGRLGRARENFEMVTVLGLLFGAIAFIAYAFVSLYESDHTSWVAVSFSLLVSAFNLTRAGLSLAAAVPDIQS